jgi:hypothetical protein
MNPYSLISINRVDRLLGSTPAYENVSDIIADIIHWCDFNKESFTEVVLKAKRYYNADFEESLLEDDGA